MSVGTYHPLRVWIHSENVGMSMEAFVVEGKYWMSKLCSTNILQI
jgi:hypothetical protein